MSRGTGSTRNRKLLILGCSDLKRTSDGFLPALDRYDGPAYRVIRKFLRTYAWPSDVSIGVLSAQHGLIGIFKDIEYYDRRMDRRTAQAVAPWCTSVLSKWTTAHDSLHLSLGRDYMPAVAPALDKLGIKPTVFDGAIGMKLMQIKQFLQNSEKHPRIHRDASETRGRYLYFLPDWDDLLDPNFDFEGDTFSGRSRSQRGDLHCSILMKPKRMFDGILLSLAQCETNKGLLRRTRGEDISSLFRPPIRNHFGLDNDQYLFGDCGAFTYVNEDTPTMTVDRAVALYESYGFDFGASVDHIPMERIVRGGKSHSLSLRERQERIQLTQENAEMFLAVHRERKAQFHPVAIIHGLSPEDYARNLCDSYEMGYRYLAIGGLVPQSDQQIEQIICAVDVACRRLPTRPWLHLFGVFRPRLQKSFETARIDSFDSATYFRKAWLRSDQNYLDTDGNWFAALRVPMTTDSRAQRRLSDANLDLDALRQEELDVLSLLCKYDREAANISEVLDATISYDQKFSRSSETKSMRDKYRRTLDERPWRRCKCRFCVELGIHMLIFRGANRNRRRGAHNTLMLYQNLTTRPHG